jgi:membrane dipeptidase
MNTLRNAVLLLTSILLAAPSMAADLHEQATAIAKRYPLVDGHVDLPARLHEHWEDVGTAAPGGNFDYPRAVAGGLSAPFMSIYIPSDLEGAGARALADTLIDQVEAMVQRAPNQFALARSAADIRNNHAAGRISLPLGMENGAALEGDLASLGHFRDRGIRYITLAHAKSNHIADSSYDEVKIWEGLSPFGEQVVREMNRLGIMVDVSHVSDAAFYRVLEISAVPVIASHSSLRHFTPGLERNVDDKMLRALADKGGVIMINFGSFFLTAEAGAWGKRQKAATAAFKALQNTSFTEEKGKAFGLSYRARFPYPYASVGDVADHVQRAVKIAGIDHVGLGSDFDGVGDSLPEGLKDVSGFPNLIEELLRRGVPEADIAKIMGGNVLRVMEQTEAYAAKGVM